MMSRFGRGLFRLWLIISAIWVSLVAWLVLTELKSEYTNNIRRSAEADREISFLQSETDSLPEPEVGKYYRTKCRTEPIFYFMENGWIDLNQIQESNFPPPERQTEKQNPSSQTKFDFEKLSDEQLEAIVEAFKREAWVTIVDFRSLSIQDARNILNKNLAEKSRQIIDLPCGRNPAEIYKSKVSRLDKIDAAKNHAKEYRSIADKSLLFILGMFIIPPTIIFIFGWSILWAIRGFQTTN